MRIMMLTRADDAADVLPSAFFLDGHVECLAPVPSFYGELGAADAVLLDPDRLTLRKYCSRCAH